MLNFLINMLIKIIYSVYVLQKIRFDGKPGGVTSYIKRVATFFIFQNNIDIEYLF